MPIRIYDIAKKLGIESRRVLARAQDLGLRDARVPSSTLDRITAEFLEESFSAFTAGSLVDLSSLATKLKRPRRAFDTWLAAQLSPDTQAALAHYQGQSSGLALLQRPLLQDLNRIMHGPSVYEQQRFAGIALRSETQALMSQNPQERDTERLNRLLIEDAYPLEVSRNLQDELRDNLAMVGERGFMGLALGNFKAFADTQNVPLRPLTLLFGANSSGKSSVIHGLLLACEAINAGKLEISKTEVGGDAVDLGGFRQYVYRHELNRRVEWAAQMTSECLDGNAFAALGNAKKVRVRLLFGISLDDAGQAKQGSQPELVAYEIEADGKLRIRLSRRDDGTMQVDRLDTDTFRPMLRALVVSATTAGSMTVEDEAAIERVLEALVPTLRFTCDRLLPGQLSGHDYGSDSVYQLVAVGGGQRQNQLENAGRLFIPRAIAEVVAGVNAALRTQLRRVAYLGPLRSFPPRHLAFVEGQDSNWFAGGGYAWDMLRRDKELRRKVNDWLGSSERLKTSYRLAVERLVTASEVRSSLEQAFGGVLPDVIRAIMEEQQTTKTAPEALIAAYEDIDYKRRTVEALLEEAEDGLSMTREKVGKMEAKLIEAKQKLERTKLQQSVLAHNPSGTGEVARGLQLFGKELSELQRILEGLEKSRAAVKAEEASSAKLVADLAREVRGLDSDKAGIVAGFRENMDEETLVGSLVEALEKQCEYSAVDELVLVDCRSETPVTHRDVGIGISQVLPVLVHAYADRGQIVAIEQPEIHLHPALQAELGDVFIESALGANQNTFVLETHSEHLILRILRRIRETTEGKLAKGLTRVRPEDVSVVFVDPTPKGSVVRHLPVSPDGDFEGSWPGGFFAERLSELP